MLRPAPTDGSGVCVEETGVCRADGTVGSEKPFSCPEILEDRSATRRLASSILRKTSEDTGAAVGFGALISVFVVLGVIVDSLPAAA